MASERRARIFAQMFSGSPDPETGHLCTGCARIADMSGAGIMLMSGDVPRGSICTTNAVSACIEQLQYDLMEGPCVDAYRLDRPVLEPDLASPTTPRWVAFTGPALDAGVRAIFGFPLQVGAVRLGALNLYRDRPGPLSPEQHADVLVLADIAAQSVLILQASAAPGQLAQALENDSEFQYVVHQAAGMVSAQLEISLTHALIRLRAYAFGNEVPLLEVATAVVGRRLRFDGTTGQVDSPP